MQNNKKVLFITNMYPSKKFKTFGIFVKNQVEAIRKKNIDVDVIAISDQRMGKIYVFKKYLLWFLHFIQVFFKGYKYSVIHVHYVFPSGLLGLMMKKVFNKRLIVTAHGGDIDRMARKNKYIFKLTRKILEHSDHVIAVGDKLREDINRDFDIPLNKISVLNMGVNRKIFKPSDKADAKKRLNLDKDFYHILFVGNYIKAKGLEELIQAFSMLKSNNDKLALHLIGANKEPEFYNNLKQYIKKNRIDDINFYDTKSQNEIAIWMAAADLFVLPSHIEGFGLVALEAMSCHTPVVGTKVGGLAYLLQNEAGILVKPKDIESLKDGLESVMYNEMKSNNLILHGEEKAEANKEEILIDKLIHIYQINGE